VEREPFRAMISAGMADSVMTAHLVDRRRDSENPVTLSPGFMDAELRGVDGFPGAVVTDDLCMGAIQLYHSLEDIVIKAIRAGDDILLFSNNPATAKYVPGYVPDYDISTKVIAIVMAAIARGEIDESRIDASWARIRALRERMRR
jgi:beta-N-acetylhexosaminidase